MRIETEHGTGTLQTFYIKVSVEPEQACLGPERVREALRDEFEGCLADRQTSDQLHYWCEKAHASP